MFVVKILFVSLKVYVGKKCGLKLQLYVWQKVSINLNGISDEANKTILITKQMIAFQSNEKRETSSAIYAR